MDFSFFFTGSTTGKRVREREKKKHFTTFRRYLDIGNITLFRRTLHQSAQKMMKMKQAMAKIVHAMGRRVSFELFCELLAFGFVNELESCPTVKGWWLVSLTTFPGLFDLHLRSWIRVKCGLHQCSGEAGNVEVTSEPKVVDVEGGDEVETMMGLALR